MPQVKTGELLPFQKYLNIKYSAYVATNVLTLSATTKFATNFLNWWALYMESFHSGSDAVNKDRCYITLEEICNHVTKFLYLAYVDFHFLLQILYK